MAATAFIFPGQGSHSVGMGRDLAATFSAARAVFEEVDDVLDQKLSRLIFEGPADELTLTENAQPALMAVSMAALRALEQETGRPLTDMAALVAGHSLGEYTALAAAGSFTIGEAARLLRLRGQAMQRAVPPGAGAMAALLGATLDQARAICAEAQSQSGAGEVVEIANDNGGGQVVISGSLASVDRAIEVAKAQGVKRAMKLPVSAPFHCALMAPAAEAMRIALAQTPPRAPRVKLVANVSAGILTDPAAIAASLVTQVTATVRWSESVAFMAQHGITRMVELGAGKVLAGLVKRIAPDIESVSAGTPAELETVINHVQ
ncbi:MAG: ACP S-malonyltransferase [Acidiphilium sp.]